MTGFLVLTNRVLVLLAGLLGAAGVTAAAVAAHGGYGDTLRLASEFAIIHATLLVALTRGTPSRLGAIAAATVLLGTLLFCGDLSARAIAGGGLLPMAAPTGGFLLIAGWLLSGSSALVRPKPVSSVR